MPKKIDSFKKLPLVFVLLLALAPAAPLRAAENTPPGQTVQAEKQASGEGEPKSGLMDVNLGASVWTIVIFLLLLAVLYKTAWKNVLVGLKARESRIRGDIADAEAARAKAETSLQQYTAQLQDADAKVREMIAKAAADAERIAANIRAQAQADGEAEREKARKEIEAARKEAVRQVYSQAADLATTVASKIIKRNLNPQDQQDLVNETLGQLQEMGTK